MKTWFEFMITLFDFMIYFRFFQKLKLLEDGEFNHLIMIIIGFTFSLKRWKIYVDIVLIWANLNMWRIGAIRVSIMGNGNAPIKLSVGNGLYY